MKFRTWTQRSSTAIALVAAVLATATTASATEEQAKELFKAMSDYLAAQSAISFDFDTSTEVVTSEGQKLAIANSGTTAFERPDKFHATRVGGFAAVEMAFDGTTLRVYGRNANLYTEAELPGTLDTLIDTLRDTYGRPLPAADLLVANVYDTLMPLVTDAKDLGSGVIRGQECDHLAFRTDEVDWQIWIAQGDAPHPCRFVITTREVEGMPQYTVDVYNWRTGPAASHDLAIDIPADATRVEPTELTDLNEYSGIFVIEGDN
jgi:hypothetical protein